MTYRRNGNRYNPKSNQPYRLSRFRIDRFLECPRCFYFDRRLGVDRPSWPAFTLNSAVDALLKNEFDLLRKNGERHELMEKYGIDAVPFDHPNLPEWRDDYLNYKGACVLHKQTNLEICGIIDDLWKNSEEQLVIVDYKSTSTNKEVSLDDKYKEGFKKQIEIYQWIFRQKGFDVSDTGYFVYANAGRNRPKFDGRLEFELTILAHKGNDAWVEPTLYKIKECLDSDKPPEPASECEYCNYRRSFRKASQEVKQPPENIQMDI
jgi:RecB family exonuclease